MDDAKVEKDNALRKANKYLDDHCLRVYLQDLITIYLHQRCKQTNNNNNVAKFIKEYFQRVHRGYHVISREYRFLCATRYNRKSFIRIFWNTFKSLQRKCLTFYEYHALMRILCPDLPEKIILKSCRILGYDDDLFCSTLFLKFLHVFQIVFYFEDFIEEAEKVYEDSRNSDTVSPSVGVDGELFSANLSELENIDRIIDFNVIDEILGRSEFITFLEFILQLSQCDCINNSIAQLPKLEE